MRPLKDLLKPAPRWLLTRLSRRRLLAMAIDAAIVVAAYYIVVSFRFAGSVPDTYAWHSRGFLLFAGAAVALHLTFNSGFRVYTILNRYVGLPQALNVAQAGLAATAGLVLVVLLLPGTEHLLPLSVIVFGGVMGTGVMVGVRFYGRVFHERSLSNVEPSRRVLLVGAGRAAELIVRETQRDPRLGTHIVGLVDDDPRLLGMRLNSRPILGGVADIPRLAADHEVTEILIAIPSATPSQMARIHSIARPTALPIKTLPSLRELVDGQPALRDARELSIDDLLGRPKIATDLGAIAAYLRGRRVMITGAGGSIGSELARQVAGFVPGSLLLVDRDESALYDLHEDLRARSARDYTLAPTDILHRGKMEDLFGQHRPEVVFHAAAFKHVPLMEMHPDEAVLNNVKGTRTVADLAGRYRVRRFVNISTDKAVDPMSVMGATKRAGELLVARMAERHPDTHFCSVRFGNVLGSRGSVVPIFREQIAAGGPVNVTHPDMTRYFMTIEEAVQLVLQAAALTGDGPSADAGADAEGGLRVGDHGAFVLEMGEPVRIVELAHQMIGLLHDDPHRGIGVEFTGIRPGEKLHETLFGRDETAESTAHPMIRRARPSAGSDDLLFADFDTALADLIEAAERHVGPAEIIRVLALCVPTYEPFDWDRVGSFPGWTAARLAAQGHPVRAFGEAVPALSRASMRPESAAGSA